MTLPAKQYPLVIPPFGSVSLPVVGDYFLILSSTGVVQVSGDSFGTLTALSAGQGLEDTPFNTLMFTDNTGVQNTVSVLVAGQNFINQRVVGEVSVIDGGKARTLAGAAGMAPLQLGLPGAGKNNAAGVWNPAGSKRNVMLKRLYASTATAQALYLTPVAVAPNGGLSTPSNLLVNTAFGGVAKVGYSTDAFATYVTAGALGVVQVGAGQVVTFVWDEPVVLQPGNGLLVLANTANTDLSVSVPFFEEAQP